MIWITTDTHFGHAAVIVPDFRSAQQVLAEYFDIDLAKADEEREALLEEFRKAQGIA